MANVNSDYVKITLRNAGIRMNPLDKNNDPLPDILDKSMLSDLDKHLRAIKQTIISASNFTAYFNENMKKINEATGEMVQSFFVRKSDVPNVVSALRRKNNELAQGRTYLDFNHLDDKGKPTPTLISYLKGAQFEDVQMLTFRRKRAGKLAQSLAEEAVDNMGGRAYFSSPKNRQKELMSFDIPVTESEINALGGMEEAKKYYSKILTNELKSSTKYSSLETKNRKEAEEEKERAEKEKEKEKREREENTEKKEQKRKTYHILTVISGILLTVADLVRRILTNALKRASKEERDSVNAHSLGMSYTKYRNLGYQDIAHGLEEGTTVGGIQDIQTRFGDVTNIDENALKILARVMGTEVADLVRSGMGGKEPDKLFERVIDKFFNNFLLGKNSLGQDVGQAQALRELTTVLSEVSPNIAKVFARMGDEYLYGINKGKFTNHEGFMGLHTVYTNGLTPFDFLFTKELGQTVDDLTARFKTLKDNILDALTPALSKFIIWANKLNVGKSESEIVKDKTEAKQLYKKEQYKYSGLMSDTLKAYNLNPRDFGYNTEEELLDNLAKDYTYYTSDNLFHLDEQARVRKFLSYFNKNNAVSVGAMLLSFAQMREKAYKQGDKGENYSPLEWSEGFFMDKASGLIKSGRIKALFSEEDTLQAGIRGWNNWVGSAFYGGKFSVKEFKEKEKRGNLSLSERQALTYLAMAINQLKGKSVVPLTHSFNGSDYLGGGDWDKLEKEVSKYIKTDEDKGKLFNLWQNKMGSLAYAYEEEQAGIKEQEKYLVRKLFANYVALAGGVEGNIASITATQKNNILTLNIVEKDEKGRVKKNPKTLQIPFDSPKDYTESYTYETAISGSGNKD